MNKFSAAILIALAVFGLQSCKKVVGTGPVVSETRSTGSFSEIEFEVPGNINYLTGESYEVRIEAQRNIVDLIETYVSNGKLRVKVRNNTNIRSHEEITVTVTAPSVHSISLQGSGNLSVPGRLAASHAKFHVSGSGNIWINELETSSLEISISGSGNAEVGRGVTDREEVTISGSGNINLITVEAREVKVRTSGSGTTRVFATETLDATISGSGDVFYTGNPAVNTRISGSGRVAKI